MDFTTNPFVPDWDSEEDTVAEKDFTSSYVTPDGRKTPQDEKFTKSQIKVCQTMNQE